MATAYDCRLQTPFNCLIAGPTKSGKTTFTHNLLKVADEMFVKKPDYVLLFYLINQPSYKRMQEEGLIHEMIDMNDYSIDFQEIRKKVEPYTTGNGSLIIFDDSMSELKPGFEKIFTVLGHHTNCSLIYISQNIFFNNKTFRNISLNFGYIVKMRNKRDLSQIRYLAQQLCPGNTNFIIKAYYDATFRPYSYLFVDCSANTPIELCLRARIFPFERIDPNSDQTPYTVYLEP